MRLLSFFNLLYVSTALNYTINDTITLNLINHVSITGEINKDAMVNFISDIEKIKSNSVYIYINSNGGYVDYGEDIIQYMNYKKLQKLKLICIAHVAYSMAFHIYQHCDIRLILPTSKVMQHQMSLGVNGNLENIKNFLKMIDSVNNRLAEIESNRLNISKYEYLNRINSDWWLYGTDILDNNIADYMIGGIGCDSFLLKKKTTNIDHTIDRILTTKTVPGCPLVV